MKKFAKIRSLLTGLILIVLLTITIALVWLRWDSGLSRDDWFDARQGRIDSVTSKTSTNAQGHQSESVQLVSDSGLQASFRVIRDVQGEAPLPVLLILGGHRTGSRAAELFGDVRGLAIVGMDYPYDGPERAKGVIPIAKMIPLARQAILDTPPAVSLILDWLTEQVWVDRTRLIIVGASLGVPFATVAAARDQRITAILLVHGAADNRLWLEKQIARRVNIRMLHYPLGTLVHWLAYGPIFDTRKHVAELAPRPLLIIGARYDERTPAGQTQLLFDAAGEPKRLRWTDGEHIQPNRVEIIESLLRIVDEEMAFLTEETSG